MNLTATYIFRQTDDGVDRFALIHMVTVLFIAGANETDVLLRSIRVTVKDGPPSSGCDVRERVLVSGLKHRCQSTQKKVER